MIHRYVRGRVKVSAEPMECQASCLVDVDSLMVESCIVELASVILECLVSVGWFGAWAALWLVAHVSLFGFCIPGTIRIRGSYRARLHAGFPSSWNPCMAGAQDSHRLTLAA
jgi:hypothetical protein